MSPDDSREGFIRWLRKTMPLSLSKSTRAKGRTQPVVELSSARPLILIGHQRIFHMKCVLLTTAALLLVANIAAAQDQANREFLTKAIQGNYAEVKMGELAEKNGQSGEVKTYGEMLKTEHSDANKKAIEAAKSMGVTPPTEPNAKQKADYDEMAKLTGPSFDKKFSEYMVMDHKKDIEEYQTAAKKQDAAGKYATDSLPTLQKHLQRAETLRQDTGTTGSR
jgi:putative membrane protein